MIVTTEHREIDSAALAGLDPDTLRRRINYDTSRFMPSLSNLILYEYDTRRLCDVFTTYFRIGAEWLDTAQTRSLVVVPKIPNIDFLEMFMSCLHSNEATDNFDAIYDIDFEARPIRSKALSAILSPLLVIQFLMVVKRIASRGLRKGYVTRRENLPKGRLNLRATMLNALRGHKERANCTYDEFSADTEVNRYIKKALVIAKDMVSLMHSHRSYAVVSAMCNQCLSVFATVGESLSMSPPISKTNSLYHEYADALRFAHMIIRHQDIAVNNRNRYVADVVPVFRIDMALLFEHYALSLLRRTFGQASVMYQTKGYHGRFIADFLLSKGNLKAIIDTKYVFSSKAGNHDHIKQLSDYARDKTLLKAMGIDTSDEDAVPVIPCVILYPDASASPLSVSSVFTHPDTHTLKFYTHPIQIPTY